MANPFDQFDAPQPVASGSGSAANPANGGTTAIAPATAGANPFDQFDAPASSDGGAKPLTIRGDPAPSKWDTAADLVQSAATGVEKAGIGLVGLPGDAAHYAGKGMSAAANYVRGRFGLAPVPYDDYGDPSSYIGSDAIRKGVEAVAGPMYQPQTTAGKYAQTVGEFVPGAGRSAASLLRNAVLPGVASEAAGEATQGTAAEPYARTVAAILAPGAAGAARRVVTPLPTDPGRLAMVDTLRNEGVTDLTAGQITGSKKLRYLEGATTEIPFAGSRAGDMEAAQKAQFTAAAMRRMGSDADNALPENFAPARGALGATFNDLASRNTLQFDPQMMAGLRGVLDDYRTVLPSERHGQVYSTIAGIVDQGARNGNALTGRTYQDTRSRLSRDAQSVRNSDPAFANALRGIRDTLDDAMGRSISPEDADAWQTVRGQYANSKVLEKAATGAGESAAEGNISPAALRSAAVTGRRGGYAAGNGLFDDLARAGSAVMSPLPNSGTAGRSNAMQVLKMLGGGSGGIGATIGGFGTGTGAGAAAGLVAGVAAPAIAGRAIMSRPVQSYLANQLLPPGQAPTRAAVMGLLAMRANALAAQRVK